MDDKKVGRDQIPSLIADLAEAARSAEQDDLSGLAKMHGWCEALVQLTGPKAEQPCPNLHAQIAPLTQLLEALVLGEREDPGQTLGQAQEIASRLTDFDTPPPSEAEPVADAPPSADDVAAKMDLIFDDAPAESPPETSPGPPPAEAEAASDTPSSDDSEPPYESEPLKINPNETEFVKGFVEEASEHLEAVEGAVLEVERTPDDREKINDLFRPFHTIKGMAGFLNLRDVNRLTHEVETLLDQARKGQRRITSGLIDLAFDVVDILKAQIAAIAAYLADPQDETVPQPPVADMIGHLRAVVAGRIEPTGRQPTAGSAAQKTGENLVEQGSVAREAVDFALARQESGQTDKKTGEILIGDQAVTPRQVSQAIRPQAQAAEAAKGQAAVAEQSVRIETGKLDALVDMVGELVIAQTLVFSHHQVAEDPKLSKDMGQVGKIVRDVQEVAMGMRMIPIGATFQRMARPVRDVSRKAGKQVKLHVSGEDTELDKNVIQQIGDPLVHMVRNAVDHGIEPPEVRRANGKPELGNVYLAAFHHGGNIVIEIRDDGKGLDREALIAKAVEKGVLTGKEELTDKQAFDLIFAAGFSMAEKVTDISGRGVGMDVVKRNIEQLRGRVEITSQQGSGSTFSIRLPLTLAIIDGMIVRVGSERFIIPTINIEQSLRPRPEQLTTVQRRGEVLQVRGELVPVIQLGKLFGLTGGINPCETMVVVAQCDNCKIGIVIEDLLGQQQVVIKSLGERFEGLRGISGAAILGDGHVGLILEMLGLEAAHNTFTVSAGTEMVTRAERKDEQHQEASAPAETEPVAEQPSEAEAAPALALT